MLRTMGDTCYTVACTININQFSGFGECVGACEEIICTYDLSVQCTSFLRSSSVFPVDKFIVSIFKSQTDASVIN